MYYCGKCNEVYNEMPESKKCKSCSGRIFYKKRAPIVKKVKADWKDVNHNFKKCKYLPKEILQAFFNVFSRS